VRYLGCPPKAWTGEAPEELLGAMICDIFEGGNFGKKSPDRARQIKYIADRDDHTVGGKGTVRKQIYRQFQLFETEEG
jgi:hypothetical protein